MKISLEWLKSYVDLPEEVSPEELARKLTFAGFEVESLTYRAKGFEKIFVGQILERRQHPNADRLSLTVIDVGTALSPSGEKLEIVCGAQNIKPGQKIPVATLGAVIPNGLEIKAAKIRGVASQGMLCSLDELQLPKEWQKEDGIFILPENAEIGAPAADVLGLNDWVFDVSVTPNRGDALSHIGVAREVAALYGKSVKTPEFKAMQGGGNAGITIKNEAGRDLCPQYYGRLIEGVKLGPSPEWLKRRIESVGLRSISNVVDITSYVMFEMGQPLHAFDAAKVRSEGQIKITVRPGKAKEKFVTLAEKEVELEPSDLVIAAGEQGGKAVALAGVIGGANSEVSPETKDIFLEAAEFHPVSVRKTARRLVTLTDAAYRFERGVDSARVASAMDRATQLILEIAGGSVRGMAEAEGSREIAPMASIRLRHSDVQKILGKAPDTQGMVTILRALGFSAEIAAGEQGVLNIQVPHWRKDIKRVVDLVEEIGRVWGYEHLESKLPLGGIGAEEPKNSRRRSYFQVRRLRRHLTSLGFFEALNYGFSSPQELGLLLDEREREALVEILNPVTTDFSVMKPTLLSGLLRNAAHNFAHKQKDIRLFEVRRVFRCKPEAPEKEHRTETGVRESLVLSLVFTGDEVDDFWQGKSMPVDFYSLKGVLESVFDLLGASGIQFQPGSERSYLHPGQSAVLRRGKQELGVIGRLHPRVEKNYEFEQPVFVAELELEQLVGETHALALFKPYGNFPLVERDFSALVKQDVNAQMIRSAVTKVAKPLLKGFRIFDVYKGSRVPEGHISYAFRITLGSDEHTLTDAEINGMQEKVMQTLEKEFAARFAGL